MIYEIRNKGGLGDVVKWTAYFKKFAKENDIFLYNLEAHGGGPACWTRFKLCFDLYEVPSILELYKDEIVDQIFNMGNPEYASYDNPIYYAGVSEEFLWSPIKNNVSIYLNNDRPGWRARGERFEDSGKSGYKEDMKRWNHYKLLPSDTQTNIKKTLKNKEIKYTEIGLPNCDFYQSVEALKNSALCIGIEGGWAHMAHALKVPYVCLLDAPLDIANMAHPFNPYIQYIRTNHLPNFFESELFEKYLNIEIFKGV